MTEPIQTQPVEHIHHARVDFATITDKRLTLNLRSIESIKFSPGADGMGPYEAVMRSGDRFWLSDSDLADISRVNYGWSRIIAQLRRVPA